MSGELKVGLALGAGAMRGLAHVGVLEVFEEAGIPIHMVAGCSMGSIIGGMYTMGITIAEIKHYIEVHARNRGRSLIDFTFPKWGLLQGNKVYNFLTEVLGTKTFADTLVPFAASVCCLDDGKVSYVQEGELASVLRASVSIPGVFEPVRWEGKTYVDAGVLDRVPVEALHQMGADVIIGVDVGYRGGNNQSCRNIYDVLMTWNSLVEWKSLQYDEDACDIMLTPAVQDFDPSNIGNGMDIYRAGRVEAIHRLGEIIQTLGHYGIQPRNGPGGIVCGIE